MQESDGTTGLSASPSDLIRAWHRPRQAEGVGDSGLRYAWKGGRISPWI